MASGVADAWDRCAWLDRAYEASKAFKLARQLSDAEQGALAARLIDELSADDDFDRKIAATADRLDWLIEEAKADFRAGRTEELDPERL